MQYYLQAWYARVMPVEWRVQLSSEKCDRMSTCAQRARDIIGVIQRYKLIHHEYSRLDDDVVRSEDKCENIMKLLNHDGLLLGKGRCNTLALQTVYEAIRVVLMDSRSRDAEGSLEYLEALEKELLSEHFRAPSTENADHVRLLSLKHMGRGIDYLMLAQAQAQAQTQAHAQAQTQTQTQTQKYGKK